MSFLVETRLKQIVNVHRFALDQATVVQSAQNGTSTAFLWFHLGSAVVNRAARLRRLTISSQHSTVLATPSAPRLRAVRFTSAGALSGTAIVPAKNKSELPAAQAILSAAVTGVTASLVAAFGSAPIVGALTAVGAYAPGEHHIISPLSHEDEWETFLPGEGFVVYQDTAGEASDTRKLNISGVFDEIFTPVSGQS